jgi:hypothetical protein
MGKRELLLIGAFILVGIGVYHATAPPTKPGQQGFSFARIFNAIKSEIHGENSEAKVLRTAQETVPASVTRLTLQDYRGLVRVIGESRTDVSAELKSTAFGMDDATAQSRANAIQLELATSDEQITVRVTRPQEGHRSRAAELTLRVPARLVVTLGVNGTADVKGVAGVRLAAARGKMVIRDIGELSGELNNGGLELFGAREVNLKTTRTEIRIDRVDAKLTLQSTYGEIRIQRVGGPSNLRFERASCETDGLGGPAEIRMEYGDITMRGVAAPVEIEGDRTGIEIIMTAAVAITATTKHDEIRVELPKHGVMLDAVAQDARIRVPDRDLPVKETEHEQRLLAEIGGGGPLVKLRNERADIVIRGGEPEILESQKETHK